MWDHSLVYMPTEFGRALQGDGNSAVGTGHELNNGVVLVSPLLNGGRVYGALDPQTGLLRGYDGLTGDTISDVPTQREPELVATIAAALDHELSAEDLQRAQGCLLRA